MKKVIISASILIGFNFAYAQNIPSTAPAQIKQDVPKVVTPATPVSTPVATPSSLPSTQTLEQAGTDIKNNATNQVTNLAKTAVDSKLTAVLETLRTKLGLSTDQFNLVSSLVTTKLTGSKFTDPKAMVTSLISTSGSDLKGILNPSQFSKLKTMGTTPAKK